MVVCVQLNTKDNSSVDLDVLQAGINVSGRDKFLRDVARERDKGREERGKGIKGEGREEERERKRERGGKHDIGCFWCYNIHDLTTTSYHRYLNH